MIAEYKKYIIIKFLSSLLKISLIFCAITLIMNLFEEINFFKNVDDQTLLMPLFLTIINLPSVLFEIFPFIFLISTIYFFIDIIDANEINTFKILGITNLKFVQVLSIITFLIGIIIITIFYSVSSSLKFAYLDIKNNYSKDDKYLAVITENGLWIRDTFENKIKFINAEKIIEQNLINVTISEFNNDFKLERSISAKKADIKDNNWLLYNGVINLQNDLKKFDNLNFKTNFNLDKILSLFDNLSSQNLFKLHSLKEDYKVLGYSTDKISGYQHKIYSYPIYLTLMVIIGTILMISTKHNKSKIFKIIAGIIISVIVYYINYFFSVVIEAQDVHYTFSIWGPQFIFSSIIFLNLVRLNEK